jgi:BirA family biotin operon repressor/biotin-[acetyl-CoA-carboxylase] ligase
VAAAAAFVMSARELLQLLADGGVHSGERLAAHLQVSRTAVWKSIARLRGHGIGVQAQAREGYSLIAPVELLDAARIEQQISPAHKGVLAQLQLHFEVDSTNTLLLDGPHPPHGAAFACLTELQTQGRGRRGRQWLSAFGEGLALSLSWSFPDTPKDLSALSLAVGVAVARATRRLGAQHIGLKWPNDIWCRDRKLGGILIEMRTEAGGPAFVVIGVGMNVSPSAATLEMLQRGGVAAVGLAQACPAKPSRNALAGAVIDEMLGILQQFATDGFAPFRDEWSALDALRDRPVRVLLGATEFAGVAAGIDTDGGLLLEQDGRLRKFVSGEASLRLQADA